MATVKTIETEVELLKREVSDMKQIHVRLDSAIEKVAEVSSSLHRIIAVHEEKLSKQEEIDKAIFNLIENRRQEFDNNYKELHSRINKIHKDLTDEIDMSQKRLMCEIKTLNSNLDGRIGVFEKYRWIIIGAAIVLGLSMPQLMSVFKIL